MSSGRRLVAAVYRGRPPAAGKCAHGADPAVHASLEEMPGGVAEPARQTLDGRGHDRVVVAAGPRLRGRATEQPAEHAVAGFGIAGRFIVEAAAAEGVEHQVAAIDPALPEGLVEERRHPEVVCRMVEPPAVGGQRCREGIVVRADPCKILQRQRQHDGVERQRIGR